MINYSTLIAIFLIHWIADFIFQSHNMAINKSKSNYWLTLHVGTYSFLTLISWIWIVPTKHSTNYLFFFLFVFATHWITDFITSRISGYYFKKNDYNFSARKPTNLFVGVCQHNGFVTIGFDQILHYLQLLLAYYFLTNF